MSREVLVQELIRAQTKSLKMPGLCRVFEGLARQAREEKWAHEDYLHEALSAEQTSRAESAIRSRLHEARFPEMKTLDSFDFGAADGVDAKTVAELARCEWVEQSRNTLLVGPIGTGKTHLAIALGVEAAKKRHHVAFWRAADLVRALVEARDTRELTRLQRRLMRVDLLILDELGFVPFDRTGGELLFNAIADRYERKSVLLTSNLSFSEWPKVFAGDEKLTTALLDRLADRASIVTTKGKSFRMRRRADSKGAQPNTERASAPPLASLATAGDVNVNDKTDSTDSRQRSKKR
jgi:DNA replication protein DnaC